MKNKAFTLIELLAVIVILAIIALIATPLVLNTINDVKKGAFKTSVYGIIEAAELGYSQKLLKDGNVETTEYSYGIEGKQDGLQQGNIELNYKGNKPKYGTIYINSEGQVALALYDNNQCITKKYEEDKLTIDEDKTKEQCKVDITIVYKENILNGSDPVLDEGMIPVVIENNGTVKKANLNEKWYKYENKEWANAVLVTSDVRNNYNNGDIIPEDKILAYYVWIPRYKYEIFNDGSNIEINTVSEPEDSEQTINIVFENKNTTKSNGTITGEYLTHPAFTFGTQELNGIWVGKFETTGTAENPTIKPNITSLRNQDVSNQFQTSLKFGNRTLNTDGSITNNSDKTYYGLTNESRMMKNMEWGTVAYLSHSIYGINSEIRYNNSETYITGCAATNIPITGHTTPGYEGCENTYNTEIGYLSSTTGNITGIYDMSGGAWEYVMGIIEDDTNTNTPLSGKNELYNSGFNGKYGCPTCDGETLVEKTDGIDYPENKYYDSYEYGTIAVDVNAYQRGQLGDATKELEGFGKSTIETDGKTRYVSGWYHDYSHFAISSGPWFSRGGLYYGGDSAGAFSFLGNTGIGIGGFHSFRTVISM